MLQAFAILYQLREVALTTGGYLSGLVPCTLLLLRAASGVPDLLVTPARSKIKATHTDVHIIL